MLFTRSCNVSSLRQARETERGAEEVLFMLPAEMLRKQERDSSRGGEGTELLSLLKNIFRSPPAPPSLCESGGVAEF